METKQGTECGRAGRNGGVMERGIEGGIEGERKHRERARQGAERGRGRILEGRERGEEGRRQPGQGASE